jgi:hypothetical protein
MFKKESNNARYTAGDIERYHRGLMSGAERHALERAALEDPLLEEALEGYAGLPPGQAARDLSALRGRLAARVHAPGRLPVGIWWKAAAVFVVLAGAGALAYEQWGKGRPSTVVAKEVRVAPAPASGNPPAGSGDSTPVGAVTPPAEEAKASVAQPVAKAEPHTTRFAAPEKRKALVSESLAAAAPAATAPAADSIRMQVSTAGLERDTTTYASAFLPTQAEARMARSMSAKKMRIAYFQNRVTDIRNQPIAYATIQLLPSGRYLATDQNGYFRFGAGDTGTRVLVEAVGYTPQQYDADQLKRLPMLQLTEDTANLNKVVVIGYGTSRASAERAKGPYRALMDTASAQPLEGWSSYNDYISNNLQLPSEALLHHIHGVVDLTFQVDETGKPVNVSVAKSLCGSCDAEAIRLLLQGPEWQKATEGRKAKGHLKVHF